MEVELVQADRDKYCREASVAEAEVASVKVS